ncbi:MAG: MarR family winged helix-turn-helix transcriptional regulator [Candidatus Thorarchaeota archaeon]
MSNNEQNLFQMIEQLYEKFVQIEETSPPMRKKIRKEFSIIELVGKNKSCNMKDIIENLGLPSSTATRQVDKLVKLNLIKREIPAENRRMVILSLTDSGQELYLDHQEHRHIVETKLFQSFTDKEKDTLIKLIKKILDFKV